MSNTSRVPEQASLEARGGKVRVGMSYGIPAVPFEVKLSANCQLKIPDFGNDAVTKNVRKEELEYFSLIVYSRPKLWRFRNSKASWRGKRPAMLTSGYIH